MTLGMRENKLERERLDNAAPSRRRDSSSRNHLERERLSGSVPVPNARIVAFVWDSGPFTGGAERLTLSPAAACGNLTGERS